MVDVESSEKKDMLILFLPPVFLAATCMATSNSEE